MVAVRIHGLALSAHGTSPPPDRNTASSQGALMETMDAIQGAFGPEIDAEEAVRLLTAMERRLPVKPGQSAPKAEKLSFSPIQKGKLA